MVERVRPDGVREALDRSVPVEQEVSQSVSKRGRCSIEKGWGKTHP